MQALGKAELTSPEPYLATHGSALGQAGSQFPQTRADEASLECARHYELPGRCIVRV